MHGYRRFRGFVGHGFLSYKAERAVIDDFRSESEKNLIIRF